MKKRTAIFAAAGIVSSALLYAILFHPAAEIPVDAYDDEAASSAKNKNEAPHDMHRHPVTKQRIKKEIENRIQTSERSSEEDISDKIENTPWNFTPPAQAPQANAEETERQNALNRKNELIGQNLTKFGPQALDILLAEQERDFDWTHRLSHEGDEFLMKHYTGTALNTVDCHKHVCKVELKHDSAESSEQFLASNGGAKGPWAIRQFGVQQERDGERYSLLYIERDSKMSTFKQMDDVMWNLMQEAGVVETSLN